MAGYEEKHKEFVAREREWKLIRDCLDGEQAVKDGSYLPILSGHKWDEYQGYLDRAIWYGATSRTVQGLAGALLRKPPALELPDEIMKLTENITQTGITFPMFAKTVAEEVLAFGRYGLLVDVAENGSEPYFAGYRCEKIRNWRTEIIAGIPRLVQVVLYEIVEVPSTDGYGVEEREQYRILHLRNDRYIVELYTETEKTGEYRHSVIEPKIRGRSLTDIPFLFINPFSLAAETQRSLLLDLATLNIHHYRVSADWRHALYFTSLPQPWVSGITEEGKTWQIGSSRVLQLPPEAKAGMLEFTGQGIGALERGMAALEQRMAVLGARLLEDQKAQAETAEAVRTRHAGENSTMAAVADTLGRAFEAAFRWMSQWKGQNPGPDAIKVRMNTDFVDEPLNPQQLLALVGAWQSGAIPQSVLWHNLRQGEIIPVDITDEQLADELAANPPMALLMQQQETNVKAGGVPGNASNLPGLTRKDGDGDGLGYE